MVSTPEGITVNILMTIIISGNLNNPSARKLLSQFSEVLNVKQHNTVCIMGTDKRNPKSIRTDSELWYSINNWILHTKNIV